MDAFDHILHWKLTHGSHPFPGKDGGTCINEAAIVAAGFKYQAVRRVEDMPECFSRPICRLAMGLNDAGNDVERQQLIRFVTRLACADTPEVERERAAYIHSRTARHYTFVEGLQILEGVLAIGREAEDAAPEEVTWWRCPGLTGSRREAARVRHASRQRSRFVVISGPNGAGANSRSSLAAVCMIKGTERPSAYAAPVRSLGGLRTGAVATQVGAA